MTDDKNIIKGNRHVLLKPVKNRDFYVIVEMKSKNKKGKTDVKSVLYSHFGTRLQAKNALYEVAKKVGGEVTYFGAFQNYTNR